ncbi:PREDICTED: juvenile hormone epoxide hydrolase 2-like [Wasmannia auropunctata]|uniref:juvenile hormone epoxide hydrolase 2-like n=1 Tax=Wasmannia auropunctata TaxID=64793 RepID=UPI0005F08569|nr:PREDICTED: juvenile hormone epoxide hydrolase 2-like [Wasmannia auropunctata]
MVCLLCGAFLLGCCAMLFTLTRRYFCSRGAPKLTKLPETWWTPGTEGSVNNDIRPYKVTFSEEVIKDLKYRLEHTRPLTPPLKDVAWNYGTNTDAPSYIIEKFSTGTNVSYKYREDGGFLEKYTYDELIDNLMIYWVSNSMTTAMRIYAEQCTKSNISLLAILDSIPVKVPSACAQFPHEIMEQSPDELRTRFVNLLRITKMPRGGHFAAFEEPELLANDIWISIDEMEKWNKKHRETIIYEEEDKRS